MLRILEAKINAKIFHINENSATIARFQNLLKINRGLVCSSELCSEDSLLYP